MRPSLNLVDTCLTAAPSQIRLSSRNRPDRSALRGRTHDCACRSKALPPRGDGSDQRICRAERCMARPISGSLSRTVSECRRNKDNFQIFVCPWLGL